MEKIHMVCYDPECHCEDMCCQECEKVNDCPQKCSSVLYIKKIYSNKDYLIKELIKGNDEHWDSWIIEVGAKRLEELSKTNKELLEALKSLVEVKEIAKKDPEIAKQMLEAMECRWKSAAQAIAKAESKEEKANGSFK